MDSLIYLFAATVALVALLATIAIWSPRRTRIRAIALVATALLLPLGYTQLTELLSRPKPMSFEWFNRDAERATILGVSFEEGSAIFLWLRLDDSSRPRFYSLPWRQDLAERLEEVVDDAITRGATAVITTPFSPKSLEELGNMNIEIIPPRVPPTKTPSFEKPQVLDPRRRGI